MKISHLSLLFFFLPFLLNAQDFVSQIPMKIKGNAHIEFLEKGDASSLAIIDKQVIRILNLQSDEVKEFPIPYYQSEPPFGSREVIDMEYDSSITIYSYSSGNGYERIRLYEDGSFDKKQLYFAKPQNEALLSSFHDDSLFYIMTAERRSSILHFYRFKDAEALGKKSVDFASAFPNESFISSLRDKKTAPGRESWGVEITRISSTVNDDLYDFTDLNKFYIYDSILHITLDKGTQYTKLISISLNDFSFSHSALFYPGNCLSNSMYAVNNSNSFITNNKIYQIRTCADKLTIRISMLDATLINEWTIPVEEFIQNQKGVSIGKINNGLHFTELSEAKKTLRKLSKQNVGISMFKEGEIDYIKIDGILETTTASPGGFGGVSVGFSTSNEQTTSIGLVVSSDSTFQDFKKSKHDLLSNKRPKLVFNMAKHLYAYEHNGDLFLTYYLKDKKQLRIIKY